MRVEPSRRMTFAALLAGIILVAAGPSAANLPPLAPTFIEPDSGDVLSAADPHFNIMEFADPDSGDVVRSSDYEVWDDSLDVRVWAVIEESVSVAHVHIRDGEFEGPVPAGGRFEEDRAYRVRARYRDSSGALNDTGPWSDWVPFRTAPLAVTFPLLVQDVLSDAALFWSIETGQPIDIPSGVVPASLEVRTPGGRLLTLTGSSGSAWLTDNPPALPLEGAVALVFRTGTQSWTQPLTRLKFNDEAGKLRRIYLPELNLPAGDSLLLWVNEYGATWYGSFDDVVPEFDAIARQVPIPWVSPASVTVEKVVGGLDLPVNLAFLPDPGPEPLDALFFVTELYGKVKVVTRNYTVITILSDLLNFEPTGQFGGSGEIGVTGIAYYPPENALYITLVYQTPNTWLWGRVMRADLATDRKSVTSTATIFEGIPIAYSHQVHAVTIAPDGNLFVNTGDGSVSTSSQDPNDLRGKILRMTRTGAVPFDNPIPGSYVYALGLRNPFGAAFRPGTNDLFVSDNGSNRDDRIIKVAPNFNYGWCCSTTAGALKLFNPTVAPTALCFPPDEVVPSGYEGRMFMALSGPTYSSGPSVRGRQLWSFALDDTGAIVTSQQFLTYVGSGYSACVGLAAGPDGLYFTDLYGEEGFSGPGETNASIYRVTPLVTAAVKDPVAAPRVRLAATPNPTFGATRIELTTPAASQGTLRLFDAQGRLRRTLGSRLWPAGASQVEWDGRDDRGQVVPSGVYFARLSGAASGTVRIVIRR
jgi:glucose/arabinose dehydrogenase